MVVLNYAAWVVGGVGVAVIGWGVLIGVIAFVRGQIKYLSTRGKYDVPLEQIRYDVGRYLLLGLEFLIAADIIRTIANPNLDEVIVLAIIVAIRTVLSYFINREIQHTAK